MPLFANPNSKSIFPPTPSVKQLIMFAKSSGIKYPSSPSVHNLINLSLVGNGLIIVKKFNNNSSLIFLLNLYLIL
jgi:hypothetical protein